MAQTAREYGDHSMIAVDGKLIPEEILGDSVLVHLAAAYFAVARGLEQKTGCSATRGFILSTLRAGTALNQNQIAKRLGFDRTVVHRAIRIMVREELVSEKKARTGKAILLQLTAKGTTYREGLIEARRAADENLRQKLTAGERSMLLGILRKVAGRER
jgi:DNA-binding MarR family transcriptional regulator